MEMLWHATAKHAPAGDLGKYKPAVIARWLDWEPEAVGGLGIEQLLEILVETGWLEWVAEPGAEAVLIVHDWSDHADDYVHRALYRAGIDFADGTPAQPKRMSKAEKTKATKAKKSKAQATGARRAPSERPAGAKKAPSHGHGLSQCHSQCHSHGRSAGAHAPTPESPEPDAEWPNAEPETVPTAELVAEPVVSAGEDLPRYHDAPPDGIDSDVWSRACSVADAIEEAGEGGAPGAGCQTRALAVVAAIGRDGWTLDDIERYSLALTRLAARHPKLGAILDAVRRYPDGIGPVPGGGLARLGAVRTAIAEHPALATAMDELDNQLDLDRARRAEAARWDAAERGEAVSA